MLSVIQNFNAVRVNFIAKGNNSILDSYRILTKTVLLSVRLHLKKNNNLQHVRL
jgi:hypothetical protein